MSKTWQRSLKLKRIDATIVRAVEAARQELVGREARLWVRSKYNGRKGVITEVAARHGGGLCALLMILRADGKDYLNSEPHTRTYWPLESLELTSRRVFGPPKPRRAA